MRRLTLIAALIVSALALAAAGCGGGDDESSDAVPADQWADEFCTAVGSWKDSLQEIRDRFQDLSSLNEDSLNEAADDAESATDEFVDDLKDLGRPDTASGEEIEDSLQTLEDTVEQEKSDVKETVDNVEDISDIPAAITTVGSALTSMGTALQSTFDAIRNEDVGGELETALDQSEACEGIIS
jgi:methyl-accepting chemotaxis protein